MGVCFSQDIKECPLVFFSLNPGYAPLPLLRLVQPVSTVIFSSLLASPACSQVPRGPATYPPVPKLLSYCGSPGSLHPGSFVLDDLRHYSVDLRYTVFQTTGSIPISTVVISEATGSRTILHAYRFVHLSAPCQLPPLPSLNFQNRILLSEALMLRRLPTPVGGPGHL